MSTCVNVVARRVSVTAGSRSTVLVQVPAGRGPRGAKGDPGDGSAGLPLNIVNPQVGDVLVFDGNHWANEESDLVDGGNF